jgi:hypothetical protein
MSVYRGRCAEITLLPAAWEFWRPLDLTLEELIKSLFARQAGDYVPPDEQAIKQEIIRRLKFLDTADSIYFSIGRKPYENVSRPGYGEIHFEEKMGGNPKRKGARKGSRRI